MLATQTKIVVALDGMTWRRALSLARHLEGSVWGFKLNDLIDQRGVAALKRLQEFGHVWADVKLYDIGNTVKNRLRPYVEAEVDFVTIAADAWDPAMRAASEVKGATRLLAVTVLTSLEESDVRAKYGYPLTEYPRRYPVVEEVQKLTRRALACGLDGIVCSPHELQFLDALELPEHFIRATPNIRLQEGSVRSDDQNPERSATPLEAIALGADFLVIGRPITQARKPLEVVERIIKNINPDS